MFERRFVWSCMLMLFVLWPAAASAEVPETFTYTGTLQKDGQPYDGMVSATFALYDSETGGEEVWSESISSLQVQDGQFIAQLGSQNPFEETFDGQDLWLEVTVEETTLTPRNHIGSLPYAHRAEVADTADDAETVGGKEVGEIESSAADNVQAADVDYDNSESDLSASTSQAAIDELAALEARVAALEQALEDDEGQTIDVSSALSEKADSSRVDSLQSTLEDKADSSSVYTQSEIDSQMMSKADSSSVYTQSEIDSQMMSKADSSSVYTQSEIDSQMADKADSSSVYSKATADSTFATKTELGNYYTQSEIDSQFSNRVAPLETKTQNISASSGETTVTGSDVFFEGLDVHVVNGTGDTSSTNGSGNLIVGYNDTSLNSDDSDSAAGSHNIVVGDDHSYTVDAYGGLLVGYDNKVDGRYASVSGGRNNVAAGQHSSVSGGASHEATSNYSSISGGFDNTTSAGWTSVTGGTGVDLTGLDEWGGSSSDFVQQ